MIRRQARARINNVLAGAAVKAKKPGRENKETDAEQGNWRRRASGGHRGKEACWCKTVAFDRLGQVRKGCGTSFLMLSLCFEIKRLPEAGWHRIFS